MSARRGERCLLVLPKIHLQAAFGLGDMRRAVRRIGSSLSNIKLKSVLSLRLRSSDVPTTGSFANGFAILSQTPPPQARRLTWCYVPEIVR